MSSGAAVASGMAATSLVPGFAGLLNHATAQESLVSSATINSNGVRLRSKPGLSGSVIGTLNKGTAVTRSDSVEPVDGYNWVSVTVTSTKATGYVAQDFLTSSSTPTPGNWPDGSVVYVADGPLNLRATANGTIKGTYPTNTTATVTGNPVTLSGTTWVPVTIGREGTFGYFAGQFLKRGNPGQEPVNDWPNGTNVEVADGPLNLRATAAGTVKRTYPTGTAGVVTGSTVTVSGRVWVPVTISLDGQFGYFASEFLRKTSGSTGIREVRIADGPLNVRSTPNGTVLKVLQTGSYGNRTSDASQTVSGVTWVKVRFYDAALTTGWVAEKFLDYV